MTLPALSLVWSLPLLIAAGVGVGPPQNRARVVSPRSETRAVIEAKFAAVSNHDADAIAAFYSEDAVLEASDFCALRQGQSEVRRTYAAIFAAAPKITAQVQELIVQGETAAARVLLESDAPGHSFKFPIMNFFTVRNGKITRDVGMFDNGGRTCKP